METDSSMHYSVVGLDVSFDFPIYSISIHKVQDWIISIQFQSIPDDLVTSVKY